jgi:hypothetical protein
MTKYRHLVVTVALAGLTALLLFIVYKIGVSQDVGSVLVILSGMTTMASFSALARLVGDSRPLSVDALNEEFLITAVNKAVPQGIELTARSSPDWEISASSLVGRDNALALAKVRLDLERELRRLAPETIAVRERSLGIVSLARQLMSAGILPENLYYPLRAVTDIANKGIHGEPVSSAQTSAAVAVAEQIIGALATLRRLSPTVAEP